MSIGENDESDQQLHLYKYLWYFQSFKNRLPIGKFLFALLFVQNDQNVEEHMRKKRKCVIVLKSFWRCGRRLCFYDYWHLMLSLSIWRQLTLINHVSNLFSSLPLVQLTSSSSLRKNSLRWGWSKMHLLEWCSYNCLFDQFPSYRLFPS